MRHFCQLGLSLILLKFTFGQYGPIKMSVNGRTTTPFPPGFQSDNEIYNIPNSGFLSNTLKSTEIFQSELANQSKLANKIKSLSDENADFSSVLENLSHFNATNLKASVGVATASDNPWLKNIISQNSYVNGCGKQSHCSNEFPSEFPKNNFPLSCPSMGFGCVPKEKCHEGQTLYSGDQRRQCNEKTEQCCKLNYESNSYVNIEKTKMPETLTYFKQPKITNLAQKTPAIHKTLELLEKQSSTTLRPIFPLTSKIFGDSKQLELPKSTITYGTFEHPKHTGFTTSGQVGSETFGPREQQSPTTLKQPEAPITHNIFKHPEQQNPTTLGQPESTINHEIFGYAKQQNSINLKQSEFRETQGRKPNVFINQPDGAPRSKVYGRQNQFTNFGRPLEQPNYFFNFTKPGLHGVPIGGSIYDEPRIFQNRSFAVTEIPFKQYTGPLNTTPHVGCPAALKCVEEIYCTWDGVMSDNPVVLSKEQLKNKVPLSECQNIETGIIGKCCRDPNYKDPWPSEQSHGVLFNHSGYQTERNFRGDFQKYNSEGIDLIECNLPGICTPQNQCTGEMPNHFGKRCLVSTNGSAGVCCKNLQSAEESTSFQKNSLSSTDFRQPLGHQYYIPKTQILNNPFFQEENPLNFNYSKFNPSFPSNLNTSLKNESNINFIKHNQSHDILTTFNSFPNNFTGKSSASLYSGTTLSSQITSNLYLPKKMEQNDKKFEESFNHRSTFKNPSLFKHTTLLRPDGLNVYSTTPQSNIDFDSINIKNQQPNQPQSQNTLKNNYILFSTSRIPEPINNQPKNIAQNIPQGSYFTTEPLFTASQVTSNQRNSAPQSSVSVDFKKPSKSNEGSNAYVVLSPTPKAQTNLNFNSHPFINDEKEFIQPNSKLIPYSENKTSFTTANSIFGLNSGIYSGFNESINKPQGPPPGYPFFDLTTLSPGNNILKSSFDSRSGCGLRNPVFRPNGANGITTGFGEFPWQALIILSSDQSPLCSGAIVSETVVVTSAYCINELRSYDLMVKTGDWKLGINNSLEEPKPFQITQVAAISKHPNFDPVSRFYDLAALVLTGPLNRDSHIDVLCVGEETFKEQKTKSNNCIVSGWGRKSLKENIPGSVLHSISVNFMNNKQCENAFRETFLGKYFQLNKSFGCILPVQTDQNLCEVNIGSPIACQKQDGRYELKGIYSWDLGCQNGLNAPAAFADVDTKWLNSVIKKPLEQILKENKSIKDRVQNMNVSFQKSDITKPGFSQGYGK